MLHKFEQKVPECLMAQTILGTLLQLQLLACPQLCLCSAVLQLKTLAACCIDKLLVSLYNGCNLVASSKFLTADTVSSNSYQ